MYLQYLDIYDLQITLSCEYVLTILKNLILHVTILAFSRLLPLLTQESFIKLRSSE